MKLNSKGGNKSALTRKSDQHVAVVALGTVFVSGVCPDLKMWVYNIWSFATTKPDYF